METHKQHSLVSWFPEMFPSANGPHLFFIFVPEENGVKSTIPDKPIDLKNYTKLCDLRRKFPVLYKVEFQVSFLLSNTLCSLSL